MTRSPVRLSPRDRRAVMAGAAVLLLAAGLRVAPALVRAAGALDARAAARALEVERARELLEAHPVLRDSLAARAARLVALAPLFVPGRTASEANAELASLVTAAAARHGVRVTRQEPRPDSLAGPFRRVALRLEAEGDVAGVTAWIADLEEGRQLLTTTDVVIQAGEPAAPAEQVERLRVELTVAGWGAHRGAN